MINPENFLKYFNFDSTGPDDLNKSRALGRFLQHLESSIIYALLVLVICMMYHLDLTLRFIFSRGDGEAEFKADQVRHRELVAALIAIVMCIIYLLPEMIVIV